MQDSARIEANDRQGRLYFEDPKAMYHQVGSAKLPKRVLIDLSNPTNEKIVKSLQGKVERDIGIFNQQA